MHPLTVLHPIAAVELNPSMLEEVDLQAPGEGGGRYQTTVSSVPHWLPDACGRQFRHC